MRLVKEFESGGVALLGLLYGSASVKLLTVCFAFNFSISPPFEK